MIEQLDFPERPTATLPAIPQRRVVYPRPMWQRPAFVARLACLTLLVAILAATGAAFFSVPHGWTDPFAQPARIYPACASETLVKTNTGYLVNLNEIC